MSVILTAKLLNDGILIKMKDKTTCEIFHKLYSFSKIISDTELCVFNSEHGRGVFPHIISYHYLLAMKEMFSEEEFAFIQENNTSSDMYFMFFSSFSTLFGDKPTKIKEGKLIFDEINIPSFFQVIKKNVKTLMGVKNSLVKNFTSKRVLKISKNGNFQLLEDENIVDVGEVLYPFTHEDSFALGKTKDLRFILAYILTNNSDITILLDENITPAKKKLIKRILAPKYKVYEIKKEKEE